MEALGKDGRYELREKIGESPRGAVHRATDRRRGAAVIVKKFDPARVTAAALARFAEAVAALKKANHPAVVLPLEVGAADPAPFVVYPALEGETLEALLVRDGALQWANAVEIVASLATALAAVATACGQTHRALKPTNVWLSKGGGVQVLDFGVAALEQAGPLQRDKQWAEYRAPEQLDGSPGDGRADVFTLAVLLYELTTGTHPFAGATAYQAAQKLSQTPPDLSELTRGMSLAGVREASKLMNQALGSEPDERPDSVAAFSTLLNYARPIVGAPAPTRTTRAEPEAAPAPDPSTLQSLPHLRQLLVQRLNPAATPVIATPGAAPPATSPPPATAPASPPIATAPAGPPIAAPSAAPLEPLPPTEILTREDSPRLPPTEILTRDESMRAPSRPLPAPVQPRKPSPSTAAPAARVERPAPAQLAPEPEDFPTEAGVFERPAPARAQLAPEPEDFPTEAGVFERPEPPRRPATQPSKPVPAARPVIAGPAPADRTIVDYAMPTAAPRRADTPGVEKTEILKQSDIDDDDENRPTRAMIREPRARGELVEGTLMLPDQPIPDEREAVAAAPGKRAGVKPPSAKVQWTLVVVNTLCVLLVLAALAYTFLL